MRENRVPGLELLERRRLMCIDHLGHNTLQPHVIGQDTKADEMLTPAARLATEDAWTQGNKTVLYIRTAYADSPTTSPETLGQAQVNFSQLNNFWSANSYRTLSFTPTITDVIVLPKTQAEYNTLGDGKLYDDARAAATAANPNWNYLNYNLDAVRFNGGPGGYAGQAYVGGRGVWLKSSGWGVAAHEFGHNLGLWHANYRVPTNAATVIGPGSNEEYGDQYDIMGNAGDLQQNHYNPYEKNLLGWTDASNVGNVTGSGTYRLYAHDSGGVYQPALDFGLKINRDSDRDYWIDFRQHANWSGDSTILNGIGLRFDPNSGSNGGSQYLDTTPLSAAGKSDGNLTIGRTFSDGPKAIHITPLVRFAASGTAPASIDVRVNFGNSKNAPTIDSLAASALTVSAGATVDFTAAASDIDGDELAYSWQCSDGTFSTTNSPTFSRSFGSDGLYRMRLSVSDMKGNVTSKSLIVKVGTGGGGMVSGVSTDASGRPIPDMVVRAGTNGGATSALTDSDGRYYLAGVAAGTHTINASGASYSAVAAFTNPVTVAPGAEVAARNFTATAITFGITGRVMAYGQPLGGVTLRAGPFRGLANSGGFFSVRASAGSYNVDVAPGYVAKPVFASLDWDNTAVPDLSAFKIGDCDGNGMINNADIAPFVQALTNPAAFANAYPSLPFTIADANADGVVNNADISPFVALLTGGRPAAVSAPPSTVRKTGDRNFSDDTGGRVSLASNARVL